jgi:hypothetical protein
MYMTGATITADSWCPGWSNDEETTYSYSYPGFGPIGSVAVELDAGTVRHDATSGTISATLIVNGIFYMKSEFDDTLLVTINDLVIQGSFKSSGATGGNCSDSSVTGFGAPCMSPSDCSQQLVCAEGICDVECLDTTESQCHSGYGSCELLRCVCDDACQNVLETSKPQDPLGGEDSVCGGATAASGVGTPFSGLTVKPGTAESEGTEWTFTCTKCPGGMLWIEGKYVYFQNDNVRSQGPGDYQETLTFSGNSFVNVIKGVDTDGVMKEAKVIGYYFCPDQTELLPMKFLEHWNIVIVYVSTDSPGAFGIYGNVADLAFMGGIVGSYPLSRINLQVNLLWDVAGSYQTSVEYCRVGTTLNGKVCTDPF